MQNITKLNAELEMARAEIAALRQGLESLRAYVQSEKFYSDPHVSTDDVVLRIRETQSAGMDAAVASWINEIGPKPVASPRGWACMECGVPLQPWPIYRDTDAKAEERMRLHWREMHRS